MIVAIDGPAGAGKSSVSRMLAKRLGYRFLDTGAMYRAVTLAALRRGLSAEDADDITELARSIEITLEPERVLLDGEDVSTAIRTLEVASNVFLAADNPEVRAHLVDLQQQFVGRTDTVTEGRDQGTVAFPNAPCKIFLTASPEERARRRFGELQTKGVKATFEAVLAQQIERDERDANRTVGALIQAPDAVVVCTDKLTGEQVVDRLEAIVRSVERKLKAEGAGV